MDWIHCNMCFIQPRDMNSNFVLTSCGHIFCRTCENREVVNECKICKMTCSITKLTSDMLPNVKEYFEEPAELIEKALKACRFQKGHRVNLLRAHSKNSEKYQRAKTHIQKLEAHIQKMESHIKKLDRKLVYYEKHGISPVSTAEQFNFTPYTNDDTESHFFSASQSRKNMVKITPRTPSNFPKPDSSYRNHRHEPIRTPASESPAEGTPNSGDFSRFPRNSNHASRSQSKFPMRTPPYSALNNLKIGSKDRISK